MATDFDIAHAAARVYAESLLQLAAEAEQHEAIGGQLEELRALWRRDSGFSGLMSSAAIDDDARRESLKRIFGDGRVHTLVLNLMLVLNDKRRSMILPAVCDAYRDLLDERLGRQRALVMSAIELDERQNSRLAAEVRRLTGREAVLTHRVDPDVLGGVSVQIGDRLYDVSVRRRLRELRAELLASVDRHLLKGAERFVARGG